MANVGVIAVMQRRRRLREKEFDSRDPVGVEMGGDAASVENHNAPKEEIGVVVVPGKEDRGELTYLK